MNTLFIFSLAALLSGGLLSLLPLRRERSSFLGAGATVLAALLGVCPVLQVLLGGPAISFALAPRFTLFALLLELDAVSALFILAILLVSALSAIYGTGYLKKYGEQKNVGVSWFFFNLLVLSMILVCLARDSLFFLLCWEVMAVSSFFLVAFENEKAQTRKAAWIYLVASQLGTACLLPLFLILAKASGSFSFGYPGATLSPLTANICFFLALVGFGVKAGVMPLHVWLPEAHPAAPSHVSALMSGVMIKTGIYGLIRILTILGPPPLHFGFILVVLGAASGVLGVLLALAQHDIKRLLAYHSVENIGIILMGIGMGALGLAAGSPLLASLGFAGGLLHVLNHALFKGLLFLAAGSVFKETHTREIDHLGGLLKKMPYTGFFFLIGAISISGLPPFNGFVSEFLIYAGSFTGAATLSVHAAIPLLITIGSLALIGGLCAACFTKAFGIIFLGEPRSEDAGHARESDWSMLLPMAVLVCLCIGIGIGAPFMVRAMMPAVALLNGSAGQEDLVRVSGWLTYPSLAAISLIFLTTLFTVLRKALLTGKKPAVSVTWDCGYAAPQASMQYTASSFAQPITDLFGLFLRTRKQIHVPEAYFPSIATCETETPDLSQEGVFGPVFKGVRQALAPFRMLQEGRLQVYVLYIVLTLLVLFIWKLR